MDSERMEFGTLRVINDDRLITRWWLRRTASCRREDALLGWVLEGALNHKDSLGTGSVIGPGEVLRFDLA